MKNILNYKGFFGSVEFSGEDDVFYGRIIGIKDRITYEGDSVKSLRKDFNAAVDEYLDVCAELGKEPENPIREHLMFVSNRLFTGSLLFIQHLTANH